jgi:triosephosphate isomerase
MRKKIIAANWKMNKTNEEATQLMADIISGLQGNSWPAFLSVIIAPPYIYLKELASMVSSTPFVSIAAQDCSKHIKGAFTGEVSVAMLDSIGVRSVIIGHSERRTYQQENNALLKQKIEITLAQGLQPIYCCGESLQERTDKQHLVTVENQLKEALFHLGEEDMVKCVIAYEPVWAIGTGVTATSAEAQEMHRFIRGVIATKYSAEIARSISILYGGSCNPKNAAELFACPDVDGGLIGGASLVANDFLAIVKAAV